MDRDSSEKGRQVKDKERWRVIHKKITEIKTKITRLTHRSRGQ